MAEVTSGAGSIASGAGSIASGAGAVIANARRLAIGAAVVAAVSAVVFAVELARDPERALLAYVFAFGFAFTITCGALFLSLIGYATSARWMAVIRRPIELVILPLPALAVLFVPIALGMARLYPWRAEHAPPEALAVYAERGAYLDPVAFVFRGAIYLGVLGGAAVVRRRASLRRDREAPGADLTRERRFASAMLPVVGLAFTFATIDWLMSLQGVWYSSMFPVEQFAGGFVAAIAVVTVIAARMVRRDGGLLTPSHFHALGRMLFAFTVFWAYTAFFQVMLMRIADKPEEIAFYAARASGAWRGLGWVLIVGHFAIPFLILLPRGLKLRPRAMALAGGWLIAMHAVEHYWLALPSHGRSAFHWVDLAALGIVVGTAIAVAAARQHGRSLVAIHDPLLAAGAAYRSPL